MMADGLRDNRQTCLDASMDDFISKPVSLETTRQIVEK
jgi:CheY-like chemotaxis protein